MGNKKKDSYGEMGSLMEEKKKLEKRIKQMAIPCPHTKKSGKLFVDLLKGERARCKRCSTEFGLEPYSPDAAKEICTGYHNMLNQIKIFSNDPEADKDMIVQLGKQDYDIPAVEELYNRMVTNRQNKKKKNRNDDYESFGSIGKNVSFISGGGKKKKKTW